MKNNLTKVISNVDQTTYSDIRDIRKSFKSLSKENLTNQDREDVEQIRTLLDNLAKSHPELCSKEKFVESENLKKASQSKESTFDRTNLTNDPNVSKSFFHHRPVDRYLERSAHIDLKKIPAKKAKATCENSSIAVEENMSETPVALGTYEESDAMDDEEVKKKKIRQYIEWAQELSRTLQALTGGVN
jgi:hypothetical protein